MKSKGRKGQTAVEYAIAVTAVILISAVMVFVVKASHRTAHRSHARVGSDYP